MENVRLKSNITQERDQKRYFNEKSFMYSEYKRRGSIVQFFLNVSLNIQKVHENGIKNLFMK